MMRCSPLHRRRLLSRSSWRIASVMLGAIAAGSVAGCDRSAPVVPEPPTPRVTRVAESDGVQMAVRLDKDSVPTSQLLSLHINATHQPDLVLSSPELAGQDALEVTETIRSPARRRTDGAVEQSWTISLEPDLPGRALAPGVKLTVRNVRDGSLRYIATEPIPVTVTSVLASDDSEEVTELRAVPAPPPPGESIWHSIRAIVGGATFATLLIIGLGIAAVLVIRRRLRPSPITLSRRRLGALAERIESMSGSERLDAISECSRHLRAAIAERASIPAIALTDTELLAACPQLAHIRDLQHLLPEIDHTLCSGSVPDAAATRSLVSAAQRSLDELSTFVPTKYLQPEEVLA